MHNADVLKDFLVSPKQAFYSIKDAQFRKKKKKGVNTSVKKY